MTIKLNKQDYELFCKFNVTHFLEVCEIKTIGEETTLNFNQNKKKAFQRILDEEIWRNGLDDDDNATELGWQFFKLQDRILAQIATQ